MKLTSLRAAALVAALPFAALPFAADAQSDGAAAGVTTIGVTEWTHPDALAARPAEPARALSLGDQVVLREQVQTREIGAADFVFANRSRLLVGPDCQVTLDRRYYDSRLDVEVKEYTVDTRLRCIAKADNLGADPADLIVINTPQGQIAVRDGSVSVLFTNRAGDRDQLADRQGIAAASAAADPPLIVISHAIGAEGYAAVTDRTAGREVMRREDHVLAIDRNGVAQRPVPDRTGIAAKAQAALEGLGPARRLPETAIPFDLAPPEEVVARGRGPGGLAVPEPPRNCRVSGCRPVYEPLFEPGSEEPNDPIAGSVPLRLPNRGEEYYDVR